MRIKEAVESLQSVEEVPIEFATAFKEVNKISIPEYSFCELEEKDTEWIPYMRAIGRISASMVIPYPPGIPLLIPGEKITVSKLSQLEELLAVGSSFQGNHQLEEKLICVYK